MGAAACGIGRPVLYSLSAYGEAGINMSQLLGEGDHGDAADGDYVADINPRRDFEQYRSARLRAADNLMLNGYEPLQ